MIQMQLMAIAAILDSPDPGANPLISDVCIDSRKAHEGSLFAALAGEHVDGHQYIEAARKAGASAALVSQTVNDELPQILVADVQQALGQLAAHWRGQHDCTIVGITGSNGKTTTRELVSGILAQSSELLSTSGNLNNELGLPLTMFGLDQSHEFAVIEMGAAQAGDIAYLSSIALQQIGLITNVGPAHLDGFGSEEGVARAKGEIYQALPPNGIAVINSDDPWSELWIDMASHCKVVTFGRSPQCDVSLQERDSTNCVSTPDGQFDLHISLPGEHNVQNALAAAAVAVALNIPVNQIQAGLAGVQAVPGRLNFRSAKGGWTVIDDTYNANPASLEAALKVLAEQDGDRWVVLGDMKELGPDTRKLHGRMGELTRSLGISRLYGVGDATEASVDAFGDGGRFFTSTQTLSKVLCEELHPGVTCLVKGSRSMHMEQVVEAISGTCEWREAG